MQETIQNAIQEHTQNGQFSRLSVAELSSQLSLPKSRVTQVLQQLLKAGTIIRAGQKPVLFLDRAVLEEKQGSPIEGDAIRNLDQWLAAQTDQAQDFDKLIGHDGSLSSLVEQCKATVAYPPNGLPLILTGETGTGKSMIAGLAYEYARNHDLVKSESRFVAVNCSEYANNPELLTANLFGYVKGAFTGADQDTPGLLELADGGVLFLDEVHNLKGECQEKLFHFMDQSVYHRMGDNKTWYTSSVRLIFATTEDPEKVLLKTLQRRIPMKLAVPNLAARGNYEKLQIILSMFAREEERLKVRIRLSSSVIQLLLSYPFPENIGGLKSTIQSSCVNALFQTDEEKVMRIGLKDIPDSVIQYSALETLMKPRELSWHSIDELRHELENVRTPFSFFESVLKTLETTKDFEADFRGVQKTVLHHFNRSPHKAALTPFETAFLAIVREKCSQYHLGFPEKDRQLYETAFVELLSVPRGIGLLLQSRAVQMEDVMNRLRTEAFKYFSLVSDIRQETQERLETDLNPLQCLIMTALAAMAGRSHPAPRRMGVILAHGESSASSMAMCVNQWLETHVFDAIDMPLFVSQEEISRQLNEWLRKMEGIEELFLLVDLGSLEQIYRNLNIRNVNIGIINSLSLKLALTVGQDIRNQTPMEKVFERAKALSSIEYHIERNREKPRMIICSCASGLGVAEKLRGVIMDSLPEDSAIRVMTYDYNTLQQEGMASPVFEENQVISIVGTLKPEEITVPFVALEDLILQENTSRFDDSLRPYMEAEEMRVFKKNIVKNFSLSNIMNSLTILNPAKLLEHVADAIDRLQNRLDVSLGNNTCFGLYVHVSCLIERLVMNRGIEVYGNAEVFQREQKDFIQAVDDSFADVQKFYGIRIPVEETGYMFDYIKNDPNYEKRV